MGCKYLTDGQRGKDRRATSKAGDSPVAGKAKKGTPNRKLARALETRIADYNRMSGGKFGTGKRDASGWHKPGAY